MRMLMIGITVMGMVQFLGVCLMGVFVFMGMFA
jgi:hypothetical protein